MPETKAKNKPSKKERYKKRFASTRSALHGSGVPAITVMDLKNEKVPSRLCVLVPPSGPLRLYFQKREIGQIIQTKATGGGVLYQAVEVDTIASRDLERVAFGLAALYPEESKGND